MKAMAFSDLTMLVLPMSEEVEVVKVVESVRQPLEEILGDGVGIVLSQMRAACHKNPRGRAFLLQLYAYGSGAFHNWVQTAWQHMRSRKMASRLGACVSFYV